MNLISDAEFYSTGILSGGHEAHAAVLAGDLIAKGLRFAEAIKVPFGQLAFAIQRRERVPQTRPAETMRIPILFRVPLPPGDFAANALILHGTVLAFRRVFSSPTPPATPTRGMTGTSATGLAIITLQFMYQKSVRSVDADLRTIALFLGHPPVTILAHSRDAFCPRQEQMGAPLPQIQG